VIDVSNFKAPGWNRVVTELNAPAPDDRSYLERLLAIVAQVSAARQGVLLVPTTDSAGATQARAVSVWTGGASAPGAPGPGPGEVKPAGEAGTPPIEHERDVLSAALAVIDAGGPLAGQSRVFGLETPGSPGASQGMFMGAGGAQGAAGPAVARGYILALPVTDSTQRVVAAVTLLVDARSRQAVQSTLAMAEVLVGYTHGHAARGELRRAQTSMMSLELATRLISAVNAQERFKGAALQLVNDLVRTLGAERAALGWVQGNSIRVVALSDAEEFKRATAMVRQIEGAMDECLDQEQAVLFPAPDAAQDVTLGQAITTAHRELCSASPDLMACSIPLRARTEGADRTVGVLTVELRQAAQSGARPGAPRAGLDVRGVEVLQSAADVVAPVLATKFSDDRPWPLRTADSARRTGAWLVGPRHTAWKLAGAGVIALVTFCALFRVEHRVGSTATLRAEGQRVISAPMEGQVGALGPGVQPGARVKAGDVLVEMDTRELRLQLAGAVARQEQGARQMANAMKENKAAEAHMAQAAVDKALAERRLLERRLQLARVTAPVDGVILTGELRDKVGSTVKPGEPLMLMAPDSGAPDGALVVAARVDERDVALIREGGAGFVRMRSRPGEDHAVVIESIVPLAVAEEGKNEFEVRARLVDSSGAWMRPGMEGVARLDAGRRTLLWIGTRRIIDTVRLWLW
jgi:multidrug resistance efflux pump